jgi:DNA helicase IV
MNADDQLVACADILRQQLRVYADLIEQGDRLGIVVARTKDRERVHDYLEAMADLKGKSKIIRAHSGGANDDYEPSFTNVPIAVLSVQGAKGLEFRAVHWLFCEELDYHHSSEHYYTVVTRAKTRLDLYFSGALPPELARAHSPDTGPIW